MGLHNAEQVILYDGTVALVQTMQDYRRDGYPAATAGPETWFAKLSGCGWSPW
ncbi:patched sphingolipid transporter [Aspergillus luchuensis]|uniref:Patched sphingolipid transporter n=1 Tax=Aspergillus kawachii TaxID=1069201 RepID=A0A146FAI9_ASPKA|nr:patched sphingolipid transporter [Aspergillus luchuensis]